MLLIFECIHAGPESVISVADQLLLFDEALERLSNEFLFVAHVIENLVFENEESAVDPHRPVVNGVNAGNEAAIFLFERHQVIAEIRPYAKKTRDLILLMEMVDL